MVDESKLLAPKSQLLATSQAANSNTLRVSNPYLGMTTPQTNQIKRSSQNHLDNSRENPNATT